MHADIRARLLSDHDKLRALGADLATLVSTATPCDFEALANKRWELARMVHQHLAYEDRYLFRPLADDPRPAARETAAEFRRAIDELHSAYTQHVAAWRAPDVAERWREFQIAVKTMAMRMGARLDLEEAELFPLLTDTTPPAPAWQPGMRNWARDGLALHAAISTVVPADSPTGAIHVPLVDERGLLYVSRHAMGSDEAGIGMIVARARIANAARGITGGLVATREHFVQYVEGPADALGTLVNAIERDPRHDAVTILRSATIRTHALPGCAMAYAGPSSRLAQHVAPYLGRPGEQDIKRGDALLALIKTIADA